MPVALELAASPPKNVCRQRQTKVTAEALVRHWHDSTMTKTATAMQTSVVTMKAHKTLVTVTVC